MARDTLFSGESKNIEYKVTLPDKSEKYMKTIVAFANTQGGKLVVGVDDKTHEIVGVENDILFQLMDGIANAVSDSCMPQRKREWYLYSCGRYIQTGFSRENKRT